MPGNNFLSNDRLFLLHCVVDNINLRGVNVIMTNQHAAKVDFWDVRQLADSIVKVLKNEKYARELAGQASRELDEISWELSAVKVLKNYRKLLKK